MLPRAARSRLSRGGEGTGGGNRTRHVEANLCFKLVDPDTPATRHVTSPLCARSSTRLRSHAATLPQVALDAWCLRGLGVFLRLKELPSRMLVFVSTALSVPCRNGSSASKLSAQLMTCLLRICKASRPGQLHASVGGILKVSPLESQPTVLEPASCK